MAILDLTAIELFHRLSLSWATYEGENSYEHLPIDANAVAFAYNMHWCVLDADLIIKYH